MSMRLSELIHKAQTFLALYGDMPVWVELPHHPEQDVYERRPADVCYCDTDCIVLSGEE